MNIYSEEIKLPSDNIAVDEWNFIETKSYEIFTNGEKRTFLWN
jgi:hypothetical protein